MSRIGTEARLNRFSNQTAMCHTNTPDHFNMASLLNHAQESNSTTPQLLQQSQIKAILFNDEHLNSKLAFSTNETTYIYKNCLARNFFENIINTTKLPY